MIGHSIVERDLLMGSESVNSKFERAYGVGRDLINPKLLRAIKAMV